MVLALLTVSTVFALLWTAVVVLANAMSYAVGTEFEGKYSILSAWVFVGVVFSYWIALP